MTSKHCNRCDETLPISSFTKAASRYDGVQAYCKECMKAYRLEHYYGNKQQYFDRNAEQKKRLRRWVQLYKEERSCVDCGVRYPGEPWLLEFDHLDPEAKEFNMGTLNGRGSLTKIQKEIDKCELVCVVCYRRRTASRGNWEFSAG